MNEQSPAFLQQVKELEERWVNDRHDKVTITRECKSSPPNQGSRLWPDVLYPKLPRFQHGDPGGAGPEHWYPLCSRPRPIALV